VRWGLVRGGVYAPRAQVTTKAMAEGAIEGDHHDYKMWGPYRTEYKFSRFDKTSARPRDTTTLHGKRVRRQQPSRGEIGASADVAPSVEEVIQAEYDAASQ
jgi:hypothetical protein